MLFLSHVNNNNKHGTRRCELRMNRWEYFESSSRKIIKTKSHELTLEEMQLNHALPNHCYSESSSRSSTAKRKNVFLRKFFLFIFFILWLGNCT